MLAWIIVIVVLLLLLILPLGVDLRYAFGQFGLKCRIGPLGLTLLPGKPKKRRKKPKLAQAHAEPKPKKEKQRSGIQLGKDDILALLKIVLRALKRFGAHLSVDLLRLHWTAGAPDPYDAVLQYGALNAAFNTLYPLAHAVLHIREEDLAADLSYELDKPEIDARLVATLQLWELFFIGICAGAAVLRWYWNKRRDARAAQRPAAQKGTQ